MRAWKMITAVALVMAVTGTAWAVTVPGLPNGFTYLKSRNEDMGSTYVVAGLAPGDQFAYDPATLVNGVPTVVLGSLNNGPATTARTVTKFGAPGALDADGAGPGTRLEDSWGIALLYHVNPGHLNNPGSPGSIVGSNGTTPVIYDNSAGTEGTWVTIMFHGGVDTQVTTTAGNGINGIPAGQQKQTAITSGLMFEAYAVDAAGINANLVGALKDPVNLADYVAASRVDFNTYTGWTGDTIAGSVQLISATSDYFQNSVVVDAAGNIVSNAQDSSTAYFNVDATNTAWIWNPLWGTKAGQPAELQDPLSAVPNTNVWFQWTLDNGQRGWNVHSDDVGGAFTNAVPEPVTILGVILGVGSLGGYIRRRFHA